jgi:hypothetical protein
MENEFLPTIGFIFIDCALSEKEITKTIKRIETRKNLFLFIFSSFHQRTEIYCFYKKGGGFCHFNLVIVFRGRGRFIED